MTTSEQPSADTTVRHDDGTAPAGVLRRTDDEAMSPSQGRASLAATLLLVGAGLYTLSGFLPALVWAMIFAIALSPLLERLAQRWPRHRRGLLPSLMILAVLLVFVIPIAMIAVPLVSDAHAAAQWIAGVRQNGIAPPSIFASLPYGSTLTSLWQRDIGQPGQIGELTSHAMQGSLLSTGRAIGAQAIHRLVLLAFMLLALFFLLRDLDHVADQCKIASRRTFGAAGENVGRQIVRSIHGTVNGLVLVGLGEGIVLGIAYLIAGVPHPTLFGLLTALLAMVPFGAPLAFGIAGIVLLAQGHMIAAVVIVVLGFVVTFVADHFIRPVLIGGATRLPFVWVLLGILGGVETWGLVGLFVGPAIMAALMLLWREWVGSQRGPLNFPVDA